MLIPFETKTLYENEILPQGIHLLLADLDLKSQSAVCAIAQNCCGKNDDIYKNRNMVSD